MEGKQALIYFILIILIFYTSKKKKQNQLENFDYYGMQKCQDLEETIRRHY